MIIRQATLTYSKYRNMFGLLAGEVDSEEKEVHILFAREWPRSKLDRMAYDIGILFDTLKWGTTWVNQLVGEHIIDELKKQNMKVKSITTQKQLKDPEGTKKVIVMDEFEAVQFCIELKQKNQIRFPEDAGKHLKKVLEQVPLFTEHKTEARISDYYAEGDEYDHYTRALLMFCFAARKLLIRGTNRTHAATGRKISRFHTKDELGSGLSGTQRSLGRQVDYPGGSSRSPPKYRIR